MTDAYKRTNSDFSNGMSRNAAVKYFGVSFFFRNEIFLSVGVLINFTEKFHNITNKVTTMRFTLMVKEKTILHVC